MKKGVRSLLFIIIALISLHGHAASGKGYVLGAGDTIRITVFQNPDMTTETRISEAGTITFPLIGEVKIGKLSTADAEARIASMLIKGGFLVKPQVNIAVTQVRSRQASVLGQVNKPGKYPLEDATVRVTDLLALAGGVLATGADTVTLTTTAEGKELKRQINIPAILQSGDTSKNVEISNGDIIYVDRAPVFYIYGEVQKPGAYRLERGMTVMQGISLGGGLSPRGTLRGVRINRPLESGQVSTLQVNLGDMVKEDDVIYVKESLF